MELANKIFTTLIHFLAQISYLLIGLYILIEIPMLGGYKPLVVLSGSMQPTYPVGSVIYYHKVNPEQLKEGDIITYRLGETLVTHRISTITSNVYHTKGDANEKEDDVVITKDNIEGRALKFALPYIGYYLKIFNDYQYLILIIVFVLLLEFILSNRRSVKIENKK